MFLYRVALGFQSADATGYSILTYYVAAEHAESAIEKAKMHNATKKTRGTFTAIDASQVQRIDIA